MAPRSELQTLLEALVGEGGHVYFQPPETIRMEYPCIVYKRDTAQTKRADNLLYGNMKRYQLIVMDHSPDSAIPDKVAELPMCTFDRNFSADNLNHDVFNLFF